MQISGKQLRRRRRGDIRQPPAHHATRQRARSATRLQAFGACGLGAVTAGLLALVWQQGLRAAAPAGPQSPWAGPLAPPTPRQPIGELTRPCRQRPSCVRLHAEARATVERIDAWETDGGADEAWRLDAWQFSRVYQERELYLLSQSRLGAHTTLPTVGNALLAVDLRDAVAEPARFRAEAVPLLVQTLAHVYRRWPIALLGETHQGAPVAAGEGASLDEAVLSRSLVLNLVNRGALGWFEEGLMFGEDPQPWVRRYLPSEVSGVVRSEGVVGVEDPPVYALGAVLMTLLPKDERPLDRLDALRIARRSPELQDFWQPFARRLNSSTAAVGRDVVLSSPAALPQAERVWTALPEPQQEALLLAYGRALVPRCGPGIDTREAVRMLNRGSVVQEDWNAFNRQREHSWLRALRAARRRAPDLKWAFITGQAHLPGLRNLTADL